MKNVLEIDGLEMAFGKNKVLNSIYLKAKEGTITGILGSNGCGKSTLLRIIFGELIPQIKSLRINGTMIRKPLLSSGDIKYLPQFKFLPSSMKVKKVFDFFEVNFKSFIEEFPSFEILENQKIKTLSGGERRVLETYLILCSTSKFVLLDEPFSYIAPVYVEKIIEIIHREKQTKVIILTDHLYKHLLDISDTIYLLKNCWIKEMKNLNDLEFYKYANN